MTTIQPFDPLDAATEAALRASIKRHGVIVPVVQTPDGRIIDGHHRVRIAREEGVEFPIRYQRVRDDEEAREVAITLNADRRHLTKAQIREIIFDLRSEGHTQKAIGEVVGRAQSFVSKQLNEPELISRDKLDAQPDRITGLDGKSRPAKRPSRADQIRPLAATGHLSSQIAEKIGSTPDSVRQIARKAGIKLADAQVGRVHKINPVRIVTETVAALEGLALGVELLNGEVHSLDPSKVGDWTTSLSSSLRSLNRFNKQLKEVAHA